jgi:hypothetical protein
MGNQAGVRIGDVQDGTSNTVAFWELRAGPSPLDPRGVWAYARGIEMMGCDGIGDCLRINYLLSAPDDVHQCVSVGNVGMPCWNGGDGQHGPKSEHVGGCHVTLCDGSVKFVNENIDVVRVMRNMIAIADGNPFNMP